MSNTISAETAQEYLSAGLSVLPAIRAQKRPSVGAWRTWADRLPTTYEVAAWFANGPDAACVVSGAVSGGVECLDFDNHGELFKAWKAKVDPALFARLVVERTPSGGYHAVYRCDGHVDGNLKLARGERDAKTATLIETRGEGGLFLCAPTTGYTLVQGGFAHIPQVTCAEREALLGAARELNETGEAQPPQGRNRAQAGTDAPRAPGGVRRGDGATSGDGGHVGANSGDTCDFAVRPGDDFNQRGEIRPLLEDGGWQFLGRKPDGNELWRRPGKSSGGHSATFDGDVFFVFSSNADPFEGGRGYSRFQVYAILACGGDYTRAAGELLNRGFGRKSEQGGIDFSAFNACLARGMGPEGTASVQQQGARRRRMPLGELVEAYPKMKPVLIHGFLRRGETMNIIAPPKTGKSWLVTDLALAVATGSEWFGFPCEKGRVLIIDNELHPETSANRIPKVIQARGVDFERVKNDIVVENQRGSLGSIEDLANEIEELKPLGFKLIIIDAFYRAMPKGTDENDNGTVAGIYNLIDKYAAALDCAFVLIHHTSKGNQSLKAVTDVGAGAGSQSRASDTHVILRRHREPDVVVMESVVRSFPSVAPVCLRWNWPLWNRADELDPADLEGKAEQQPRGADDPEPYTLAGKLVELVDNSQPMSKGVFIEKVRATYRVMSKTAKLAVETAISSGLIVCERRRDQPRGAQATKFIMLPVGRRAETEDETDGEDPRI